MTKLEVLSMKKQQFMKEAYDQLVEQGLDWKLRMVSGASKATTNVDGKDVMMLCSNNREVQLLLPCFTIADDRSSRIGCSRSEMKLRS